LKEIAVLRRRSGFALQRKFDLNLRFASILGRVWFENEMRHFRSFRHFLLDLQLGRRKIYKVYFGKFLKGDESEKSN